MPSKRREHDRACRCDRPDGGCAALAVQRLSRSRIQQLAEEIWTVSTGTIVPVQPLLDPRDSRPGWSASLDHLVVGSTGAWAIDSWGDSWPPRRRNAISLRAARGLVGGPRPDLSWKAEAVADSLAGTGIPVQPLLCLHVGIGWPGKRAVQGIPLVRLRRLPEAVRHGSRVQAIEVERASARALEVLRPAA
jgi:hypothetical protein